MLPRPAPNLAPTSLLALTAAVLLATGCSVTRLKYLIAVIFSVASLSNAQEPWQEPQDTQAALTQSDRYAWRLFVALNWPADTLTRQAEPNRKFGENATTVWESWKLSSGRNDEVFLKGGADPGPWLRSARNFGNKEADFSSSPVQQLQRFAGSGKKRMSLLFDPTLANQSGNENHLNQAAYEFIVKNNLYYIEGQEALFDKVNALFMRASAEGRPIDFAEYRMDFPLAAKEVKAQWRLIDPSKKDRYRWEAGSDGKIYGLTALHITTKDLPNWFWATFEHVDNPSLNGAEPWIIPSRDFSAGPNGYPQGMGIEGTRWQYYRLRGTQIDFNNPTGEPTILANSQIEQTFQTTSSCITCHARAAIGAREMRAANRLSIFKHQYDATVIGDTGPLDPSMFIAKTVGNPITGELRYMPLDFVWSLMRAQRKIPTTKIAAFAAASVGFEADIKPMFRVKDINAMKRKFDLSKYEDVKKYAEEIYERIYNGSMPCDGPWPDEDVELFRKWIDGGLQQ
jgi:hypothetical protein